MYGKQTDGDIRVQLETLHYTGRTRDIVLMHHYK
jgi:hypothetical protein